MSGQTDVTTTLNGFIRRDVRPEGRLPIRLDGPGDGPGDGPVPWDSTPPVVIRDARPMLDGATEADHFQQRGFVLLPPRLRGRGLGR